MSWWYARRATPWSVQLVSLVLLGLVSASLHRWGPEAWLLLPLGLAIAASACGFLFDEDAAQVAAVTPRGGRWAPTIRIATSVVPLGAWALVAATLPEALAIDLAGWLLAGTAAGLLAVGVSALAHRLGVPRPGGQIASAVVLLVTMPLVLSPMLGWQPVFPSGDFPGWLTAMWAGIGGVGLTLLAGVLAADAPRPFVRHGGS